MNMKPDKRDALLHVNRCEFTKESASGNHFSTVSLIVRVRLSNLCHKVQPCLYS